jgi:hypothetical protein
MHTTAVTLLCVLAWSCFGLNVGMIGHELMQIDTLHAGGHAQDMHECCGVKTDGMGSTESSTIDHHTTPVATLSSPDLLPAVLLLSLVSLLAVLLVPMSMRWKLYARQWLDHWAYFALHTTRLFSRGILHTQVW